jgi:protein-tyrosine-phosphatase
MADKANRKRTIQLHFMVTEHERDLINEKMIQIGTQNLGAYLRKMAVDGYMVKMDLSGIAELVSLLRRCSNNLNQLTRRAHETSNIYKADIEDLRQNYDRLWDMARKILTELSEIR